VNLDKETNAVILFDAHGGRGGRGGNGGKGGNGGNAGDGGRGGSGGNGSNATRAGQNGQNGGDGGPGGDGGDGGHGGRGGNAGQSGNGGDGGSIVIDTTNPALLMLAECNSLGGPAGEQAHPGPGGIGGRGGSGGQGGFGGSGGMGGPSDANNASGSSGWSGNSGRCGNSGHNGASGSDGYPANPARSGRDGTVLFRIFDDSQPNLLIEQGPTRYNVRVSRYTVQGIIDDGIFEPGEEIAIRDIQILNDGSLTVPAFQVALTIPSNDGFISSQTVYYLPEIKPGETFNVPQEFRGSIAPDMRQTVVDRYISKSTILTSATLLKRPFDDSIVNTVLTVGYPIQISLMSNPQQMGRAELGRFRVELNNSSRLNYGCATNMGEIRYRIVLDQRLKCNQGNVIEGQIDILYANSAIIAHEFDILIDERSEFFERIPWSVELFFKGRKIEHATNGVRIAPNFVEYATNSDVLFVTDQHITRKEFLLYQRIFEGLGLQCNFWDCERYGGFSNVQHPVTWVDKFKGKLIVIPSAQQDDLIRLMSARDLFAHFVSDHKPIPVQRSLLSSTLELDDPVIYSYDSGLVVVGGPTILDLLNHLFKFVTPIPINEKELQGVYLINNPSQQDLITKCTNFANKLQEKEPSRHFTVNSIFAPKKMSPMKYLLGTAEQRELPLACVERVVFVQKGPQEVSQFLSLDPFDACKSAIFPTDSRFFATLYSIVSASPIKTKIRLLRGGLLAREENWRFRTREGIEFSLTEILKATLYIDLKEEFVFIDRPLYRVERLYDQLLHGPQELYAFKDAIDILWHVLYRLDKATYWKGWSRLQGLFHKRKQLEKLMQDISKLLFSNNMKKNVNGLDEIKKQAEKDANKELRLFTVAVKPLQTKMHVEMINK